MVTNISKLKIKATSEEVWEALTNPTLVKLWQYGSDLSTNWNVGSEIRFRSEWEGKIFEQWGTVLEVSPNKKLRYSLFAPRPGLADIPENYFEMEYILTENGSDVLLEIIQRDNRLGAVQEEPQGKENPVLKTFKEIIESKGK